MDKNEIANSWVDKDGIVFIYDPVHKANIWMLISESHEKFREIIKKHIPNIDGLFSDLALYEKTDGGHIQVGIEEYTIDIVWSKNKLSVLCHEIYHAVYSILADRRIDPNESGAYLFEFILREILKHKQIKRG